MWKWEPHPLQMLGCNHAALMGERDEQNTDPSCGIATMVLVDLILQGFTVNLESSIYCIFTAQTFLVPVTLFFFFPMVKTSPAQALPIGEGPHPDRDGWCSASANPSVNLARFACWACRLFLMAKQTGVYVFTSCRVFWGSTIWRIFAFSLCPMEYMEQDLQATLWLLCALGAPKETKLI